MLSFLFYVQPYYINILRLINNTNINDESNHPYARVIRSSGDDYDITTEDYPKYNEKDFLYKVVQDLQRLICQKSFTSGYLSFVDNEFIRYIILNGTEELSNKTRSVFEYFTKVEYAEIPNLITNPTLKFESFSNDAVYNELSLAQTLKVAIKDMSNLICDMAKNIGETIIEFFANTLSETYTIDSNFTTENSTTALNYIKLTNYKDYDKDYDKNFIKSSMIKSTKLNSMIVSKSNISKLIDSATRIYLFEEERNEFCSLETSQEYLYQENNYFDPSAKEFSFAEYIPHAAGIAIICFGVITAFFIYSCSNKKHLPISLDDSQLYKASAYNSDLESDLLDPATYPLTSVETS
jgi:hypothetical protein